MSQIGWHIRSMEQPLMYVFCIRTHMDTMCTHTHARMQPHDVYTVKPLLADPLY